jgi:hypothetical protein
MEGAGSVKIEQDVVSVLAGGTTEGNTYRLPEQLSRQLYVRVNKVLVAMGGKWDRRAGGHVFEVPAAPLLQAVLESEEMPPKNPTAWFATPPAVALRLLGGDPLPTIPDWADVVLEPSAGAGHLAEQIQYHAEDRKAAWRIQVCEVVDRFQDLLEEQGFDLVAEDFLAYKPAPDEVPDAVVMNPPFAVNGSPLAWADHVSHAWDLLPAGGVLLAIVPAGFEYRREAKAARIRELVEVLGASMPVEGNGFHESGTDVRTVLIGATKR